jgi:hypothetical protein
MLVDHACAPGTLRHAAANTTTNARAARPHTRRTLAAKTASSTRQRRTTQTPVTPAPIPANATHVPSPRRSPSNDIAILAEPTAGQGNVRVKIITEFYDRARPFVAHPGEVHLFPGQAADASFPSDHATASMAIAVAFLLRGRFFWGVLTLVFAAILDFGRVAAGLHYPIDVFAGAAVGALGALLLWAPTPCRRIDALADFMAGGGTGWSTPCSGAFAQLMSRICVAASGYPRPIAPTLPGTLSATAPDQAVRAGLAAVRSATGCRP